MKQVWVFHGGSSFDSYERYLHALMSSAPDYERLKKSDKWREWLSDSMPESDVLLPNLPNGQNAVYDEWRIVFEKLIPLFSDDVSLVGYSLGAMFLAKYLDEHPLQAKVRRICLVAPGYDDDSTEDLGSFRVASARRLPESSDEIHLFHSEDDPVVPFGELTKFRADLPTAIVHTFTDRGHFFQPTFPELLDILNQK